MNTSSLAVRPSPKTGSPALALALSTAAFSSDSSLDLGNAPSLEALLPIERQTEDGASLEVASSVAAFRAKHKLSQPAINLRNLGGLTYRDTKVRWRGITLPSVWLFDVKGTGSTVIDGHEDGALPHALVAHRARASLRSTLKWFCLFPLGALLFWTSLVAALTSVGPHVGQVILSVLLGVITTIGSIVVLVNHLEGDLPQRQVSLRVRLAGLFPASTRALAREALDSGIYDSVLLLADVRGCWDIVEQQVPAPRAGDPLLLGVKTFGPVKLGFVLDQFNLISLEKRVGAEFTEG